MKITSLQNYHWETSGKPNGIIKLFRYYDSNPISKAKFWFKNPVTILCYPDKKNANVRFPIQDVKFYFFTGEGWVINNKYYPRSKFSLHCEAVPFKYDYIGGGQFKTGRIFDFSNIEKISVLKKHITTRFTLNILWV